MTLRLYDSQLLTSTYLESGVTATYLGTSPTLMILSTTRSATETRYT